MVQQGKVAAGKPDNLSLAARLMWWKERTDSNKMTADLPVSVMACPLPLINSVMKD